MKPDGVKRISRRTKWLIWAGVVLLLYTIAGFLVVPAIVKAQLLQRLPVLTKRQASVDRVKFNPYVLSLTIDGLALKETNGDVFASFSELYINFQLSSIFKRAFVFKEISLKDPFAQMTYLTNGTFNFSDLLTNNAPVTPPPASAKPALPPRMVVYHLLITNGAVAFTDMTRKTPFKIRYQPIDVSLRDFTTLPDESSGYSISAVGDSGESFAWTGKLTVSPLASEGGFQLHGLDLGKFGAYSRDYARFEISGKVDVSLHYRYDPATNALNFEITNAAVALKGFDLKTLDTGEHVVTIPNLSVAQVRASLAGHTAEIGEIESEAGSLLVRQNHDGTINLLAALVPQSIKPAPAPASNPPVPPGSPWIAKIDDITFKDYAIKVEDKVPAIPAAFGVDHLEIHLQNISNISNAPVQTAVSLRLQNTGLIGVSGSATLLPPSADLQIGVTNLDVRLAQPYLHEQVKMALARGALNVSGHARYAPATLVDFQGNVSVTNFAVTDELAFDNLATWDLLEVNGIDAGVKPLKVHIGRIKFSNPSHYAVVEPDHRLNILSIVPEKKGAPVSTSAPAAPAGGGLPDLQFGELAFTGASLHFVDRSIEPQATFDVESADGSVKNISSRLETPATVEVKGRVNEFSTFNVTGRLNPMPDKLFIDTTVTFTNTGLTPLSPYTEKYVGRPLEKGKLSLALHYQINKMALNARNDIFVDQLTLGAKNDSTNATHLPVKLAIALLKDRHGRIKLDIPVQGSLNDPKFKIGPIIWGVVENLLVKAATSPFSLLGSMFGGGKELSIPFAPGKFDIATNNAKTLEALATSLYDRPELTLEINGSVDPAADTGVMKEAKFERELKTLDLKELAAAGKPTVSVDELQLQPADISRLIPVLYSNTLGIYHPPAATNQTTNTPSAPLTPKPAVAAAPAPKKTPKALFFTHGASLLEREPAPPAPPLPMAPVQAAATNAPPAPPSGAPQQSDLEIMRARLLDAMTVTQDDFRDLMRQRARQVESYLLKTGKVTADRLFITAPRPVDARSKGTDQAALTLD